MYVPFLLSKLLELGSENLHHGCFHLLQVTVDLYRYTTILFGEVPFVPVLVSRHEYISENSYSIDADGVYTDMYNSI